MERACSNGLGNHLPRCLKRNGRDYSMYLAKKTLQMRNKPTKQQCDKCGRWMKRLDTHLKRNAQCRQVAINYPSFSMPSVDSSQPGYHDILSDTTSGSERHCSLLPATDSRQSPSTLDPFFCPKNNQEWEEADEHLRSIVVPAVLTATSVDERNHVLCQGIYNYFAGRFGLRKVRRKLRRNRQTESRKSSESSVADLKRD